MPHANHRLPTTTPDKDSPAAPDLDSLHEAVGYHLRRAQLAVFRDFLEAFEHLQLRPAEYSVLVVIAANPGINQTALSDALAIKKANCVTLLDALEARGLIRRRRAAHDRRSHTLALTARGRALSSRMQSAWRAHEERMLARLGSQKERDLLIRLLAKLI